MYFEKLTRKRDTLIQSIRMSESQPEIFNEVSNFRVAVWENFRFRTLCGRIFPKKKRGLHEEETFIEEILIAKACGGGITIK